MVNINKNIALKDLENLMNKSLSRRLNYMSDDFNIEQEHMIEMFKKRIFLEEVVEETITFNKNINWDFSIKNLKLIANAEELIKVFKLRSEIYYNINYQREFTDPIEGFNFDLFDKKSAIIFYHNKNIISGTTRLIFDSEYKLPTDKIYNFDTIRTKYNKIGELSRLIVKHEQKGLNLEFKYLMRGAYLLFMLNDIDITVLGIKREHYKLYEKLGVLEISCQSDKIISRIDNGTTNRF